MKHIVLLLLLGIAVYFALFYAGRRKRKAVFKLAGKHGAAVALIVIAVVCMFAFFALSGSIKFF